MSASESGPEAGQIALVSGASRGIGAAIAVALAADGCRVAVNYRQSSEQAEAVVAEIAAAGGQARAFQADVSDPQQVDSLVQAVQDHWGAPQILVSNAGTNKSQLLAMTPLADWRALLSTNLDAAFLLTKAVLRPMVRQRWGRIIYVSSDAALLGELLHAGYSAAKAGLLGLAKTAARELAPSNVTVNAVAPGYIETDMTSGATEAQVARRKASIPMGRTGQPGEVAQVVRFLASGAAAYVTGQVLSVDGGLCMRN